MCHILLGVEDLARSRTFSEEEFPKIKQNLHDLKTHVHNRMAVNVVGNYQTVVQKNNIILHYLAHGAKAKEDLSEKELHSIDYKNDF